MVGRALCRVVTIEARPPTPHVPAAARDEGPNLEARVDPDADVLELVEQGKRDAALRILMQRHGRAVYRFCRESLDDAARADDVHQRVFIDAHRDLSSFARRSLVRTWLFAIARHRVADEIKAHSRALRHIDPDGDESLEPLDPTPSPDERLDDARLREALAECVKALAPEIREAVLLRYQQGLTFEDMAEIYLEKPSTLQARVARAVDKLRVCIARRTGGSP